MDVIQDSKKKKEKREKTAQTIGVGLTATKSASTSIKQAAAKFAKPDSYTGNRGLYDSPAAKKQAKAEAFNTGEAVYDKYTGNEIVATIKEAKAKYGDDWQNHSAEVDHTVSLKEIFERNKKNPYLTNNDIKNIANCKENHEVTPRSYNNAKRSCSNKNFVNDEENLKKKGIKLQVGGKENAIKKQKEAEMAINTKSFVAQTKNIVETGHKAGMQGAISATEVSVTMSTITNIADVIAGEKEPEEAIANIIEDGGTAALTGYAMGSTLTVVSHALSTASSEFIQALVKSNVPGNVITAVMATGDTLKRYADGELSTQECILELGEKGINTVVTGGTMTVGQILIPIPVVGATVGAFVGSTFTRIYCDEIRSYLQEQERRQQEHQECQRTIAECKQALKAEKEYRKNLEFYMKRYFNEYWSDIDETLDKMQSAFDNGDADGVIAGANKITRRLGGKVYFETVSEYRSYLRSNSIFEL